MEITSHQTGRAKQVALVAAVVYCVAFLTAFLGDPLAGSPQLDARENLILAAQIDTGSLAEEPFYRAMLYPWILSLVPGEMNRPLIGLLIGFLAHLMTGWLIYRMADHIWEKPWTATLAAILYLVNPVCLFFAVQLLDVTVAITLFTGGLYLALTAGTRWIPTLVSGGLLGLSIMARPHFLPAAILIPGIFYVSGRNLRQFAIWIPIVLILLGNGWINHAISGDFRIMPWQGAYNLWAANRPGANGLYFQQKIDLSEASRFGNPARAESEYLYGLEHPDASPPYAISRMNDHWRTKFLEHARTRPADLLKLWTFKAYAIINNYEQYNNLTYGFHKGRLLLLKFNPICWGILLTLASIGWLQLFRCKRRTAIALLLVALAYISMLIVFYSSARFRLPLVPIVTIFAAGSVEWFRGLRNDKRRLVVSVILLISTTAITFSSLGGVRSTSTHVQDRLLLANAHADLGNDAAAAKWAQSVLQSHPGRQEAERIFAISYFNMVLSGNPSLKDFGDWLAQRELITTNPPTDPVRDTVMGVFYWKWERKSEARKLWEKEVGRSSDAAALAAACLEAIDPDLSDADLSAPGRTMRQLLLANDSPPKTNPVE